MRVDIRGLGGEPERLGAVLGRRLMPEEVVAAERAVEIVLPYGGVQPDGLFEVGQRPLILALAVIGDAAAPVRELPRGVDPDGPGVLADGAVEVARVEEAAAALLVAVGAAGVGGVGVEEHQGREDEVGSRRQRRQDQARRRLSDGRRRPGGRGLRRRVAGRPLLPVLQGPAGARAVQEGQDDQRRQGGPAGQRRRQVAGVVLAGHVVTAIDGEPRGPEDEGVVEGVQQDGGQQRPGRQVDDVQDDAGGEDGADVGRLEVQEGEQGRGEEHPGHHALARHQPATEVAAAEGLLADGGHQASDEQDEPPRLAGQRREQLAVEGERGDAQPCRRGSRRLEAEEVRRPVAGLGTDEHQRRRQQDDEQQVKGGAGAAGERPRPFFSEEGREEDIGREEHGAAADDGDLH